MGCSSKGKFKKEKLQKCHNRKKVLILKKKKGGGKSINQIDLN